MPLSPNHHIIFTKKKSIVLFALSFCLWMFCFKGFIFGDLTLTSDALAYFEHFQYFLNNVSRGVFPLWEPARLEGTPVDFFWRRIGCYNPTFSLILLLKTVGFSYLTSYLIYFSLYYFLGCFAFYLLCNRIFKNANVAFVAFLLLYFSSLSTRIFDSYILLTCVPLSWLFYFIVAFSQSPKRKNFLGATFSMMILLTTYVPFYFFTIVMTFVFCFFIVYFKTSLFYLKQFLTFIKDNKVLAVLCTAFLLASLIPGILFFIEGRSGELVIPLRHGESTSENMMAVDYVNITRWGLEEDLAYSAAYSNLRRFKFAILYVPAFSFVILAIGLLLGLRKRLVFLFTWGLLLLLMFSHYAPIYDFLYDHIFYFEYFRNLHFFLWMIILPIFILFVAEQLSIYFSLKERKDIKNMAIVVVPLIGLLVVLLLQKDAILSTYLVVFGSLLFFVLYGLGILKEKGWVLSCILLGLIVIQPLEVYRYLHLNTEIFDSGYRQVEPKLTLSLPDKETREGLGLSEKYRDLKSYKEEAPFSVYMGVSWLHSLRRELNNEVFSDYSANKLILYDNVQWVDDNDVDIDFVGDVFVQNKNVALIASKDPQFLREGGSKTKNPQAQFVTKTSSKVKVKHYDINDLKLETHLDRDQFLVFNDSFHSGWQAYIDGTKVDIVRANLAFKGLWIPKGEHVVVFRFGHLWQYALNFSLMALFYAVFGYLLILFYCCKYKTKSNSVVPAKAGIK